jgi:hypothetical protein
MRRTFTQIFIHPPTHGFQVKLDDSGLTDAFLMLNGKKPFDPNFITAAYSKIPLLKK